MRGGGGGGGGGEGVDDSVEMGREEGGRAGGEGTEPAFEGTSGGDGRREVEDFGGGRSRTKGSDGEIVWTFGVDAGEAGKEKGKVGLERGRRVDVVTKEIEEDAAGEVEETREEEAFGSEEGIESSRCIVKAGGDGSERGDGEGFRGEEGVGVVEGGKESVE